ncbi:carboxyltransferase domain-containing protein [Pseudonocardia sp. ICBG1293]|uniref:5-oxoprolinase subunit B family protein n=1 Tax=Pseudonocardia sp. ICBG1293 TaxID=2844382 RepID=UPI001CC99110|nr:carboxyltransferase domain-containing protein [Pseudonocardia sp. ICBG1293]
MTAPAVHRAGDRSWVVDCLPGTVRAVADGAATDGWDAWVTDVVPAAATVLVVTRPGTRMAALRRHLRTLAAGADAGAGPSGPAPRTVEVGVRYDGADLLAVADRLGTTPAGVARAHTAAAHHVGFFGFAPGFAYLDGLPDGLRLPRLSTPRPRVEAGVVAIAGNQTVVYPGGTPGGWHQIGTTTAVLWDVDATPPNRLGLGDRVRFVEVPG